jgi:hypothetical protein
MNEKPGYDADPNGSFSGPLQVVLEMTRPLGSNIDQLLSTSWSGKGHDLGYDIPRHLKWPL